VGPFFDFIPPLKLLSDNIHLPAGLLAVLFIKQVRSRTNSWIDDDDTGV